MLLILDKLSLDLFKDLLLLEFKGLIKALLAYIITLGYISIL